MAKKFSRARLFSLPSIELSRFRSSRLAILALIMIAAVPAIYGGVYLSANWNTSGNIDKLHAVIVNNDVPATVTGPDGTVTTIDAGAELVDSLVGSDSAGFTWLTADDETDARTSLVDNENFAVLVVPADFSSTLASTATNPGAEAPAADGTTVASVFAPEQAHLRVYTDDASNFIVGQVTKSVTAAIRAELTSSISENYLDNIYLGFTSLHDNLAEAADGALTLSDGAATASDGSAELVIGLGSLSSGADTLASGIAQVDAGSHTLATGASDLATGASTLASGAAQVEYGSASLAAGAAELKASVTTLPASAAQLAAGSGTVSSTLGTIAALTAAHPDWTLAQLNAALTAGGGSIQDLADGAAAVAAGTATLNQSATPLAAGIGTLADGAATLATGASSVSTGAQSVSTGAASLSTGAASLATGADSAAAGAATLASGATSASTGASTLADGLGELATGADTLSSSLESGVDDVPSYTDAQASDLAAITAEPVSAEHVRENAVGFYGEGLAAYFIPLALWVGGIGMYFLFRPLSPQAVASTARPVRVALTGLAPGLLFGLLQAGLLLAVLHFMVGLEAANFAALAAFTVIVALVFTAIHHSLIALLGGRGRLVALLLLILQLASAGGTYPIETSPVFFQWVSPGLPMTYAVDGVRRLIAEGWTSAILVDILALLAFGIGAFTVSVFASRSMKIWSIGKLHPSLDI
ncbi:YhgE/Pip domain-containing protein [Cryobacterium sp. PH29-G1]|uniref:YhgE/Pip domain-containing protein n=1 Tax=Cryobacterium sp. PH29-G1 TaxID=3046211 RepID=UPI0024BA8EAD|nr:YhgE/Pip domain-containing protein [Cryobacterium sp. PH29-G1]MDJ0348579.1 YhgE/Pip domain-containing protein [Cryobacterium sp. PH29-G1]